ncbi:MAG: helix-turn-helix domain-containing protein [Haloechinothrix sp.]
MTASDFDKAWYQAIREEYPPVLTTAQVSALLNIGPRTVLAMAADGRLKASRIPGTRQYNFFRDEVIKVLAQHIVNPEDVDLDEAPAARPAPNTGTRRRRKP